MFLSDAPRRRRWGRSGRRGAWGWLGVTAALAVAAVVVVVALRIVPRDHGRAAASQTDGRFAQTSTRGRAHRKVHARRHRSRPVRLPNPLTSAATRAFLATRSGTVTAAVDDLKTGQTWVLHPGIRDQTASIMKADILETLLHQAESSHSPLDDETSDLVQGMIENSSDTDAQDLWNTVGGSVAVGAYDASIGMHQTDPNDDGYWGESTTSAADQIRLLRQLVDPHGALDHASQTYELGLMQNVEPDQAWGVSGGVPAGVSVALKNGWVPLTSDTNWEINSIGRVRGDGQWYLIAVLTAHDPSQQYGIDTIQGVSKIVWSSLAEGAT